MRKIKLTKDAVDGLLDNLLKRSPNNYGQYTDAVNEIVEAVKIVVGRSPISAMSILPLRSILIAKYITVTYTRRLASLAIIYIHPKPSLNALAMLIASAMKTYANVDMLLVCLGVTV